MKKTQKILKYELWTCYGLVALLAVLYESGLLLEGALTGDVWAGTHLLTQMWMVVIALFGIPIAMKLFSLKYVRDRLTADESRADVALLRWGTLRLMLVALPMVANMWCYYLFGADVRFFYLAVIDAIAVCFIYPSPARCEYDTTSSKADANA